MANFHLGIAVVTHRGHLDIRLERLGICLLEVLQLRRPCQRADNVDVDAVLAPFGGGNAGQAANAFLCRGIRALPVVAKQTRAGGKVDDSTLRFLQIGVARLHIIECGVQTGIQCEIELLGGMVSQRNAGCGSLRVVNQHVDAAEGVNRLFDDIVHNSLVVRAVIHVRLHAHHLHAIEAFQFFLRVGQLLHVAARDDQIRAFLGVSGRNAVANRTAAAVAELRIARAGNNRRLSCQKTHYIIPPSW